MESSKLDRGFVRITEQASDWYLVSIGASYDGEHLADVYAEHRGVRTLWIDPSVQIVEVGGSRYSAHSVEVTLDPESGLVIVPATTELARQAGNPTETIGDYTS